MQISICSANVQKIQALISDDNCPFWDDWTSGSCSETCGAGEKIVTRNCIRQNKQVDSTLCRKEHPALGQEDKRVESCIGEHLFCRFDSWGAWSHCSKTCGSGKRTRNRDCPSNSCSGESTQTKVCNEQPCLSQWSSWEPISDCSKKEFKLTQLSFILDV